MPIYPEIEGLSLQDLQRLFLSNGLSRKDPTEKDLWLQELALMIAKCGSEGIAFLIQHIQASDEQRVRAIIFALSFLPESVASTTSRQVRNILITHLSSRNPWIVAEAIDSLRHLGHKDAVAEVRLLLEDESPYVVGSVIRFIASFYPEQAKPILLAFLKSKEPIVRENAVDELDELGCVEALPAIRLLLRDSDRNVRQAAETAISNLEHARKDEGDD